MLAPPKKFNQNSETKSDVILADSKFISIDTFNGRNHIELDSNAEVTPLEQISSSEIANWMLFSMASLNHLEYCLENFRKPNRQKGHVDSTAASVQLIWSGSKKNNVPINLLGEEIFGFTLDPNKIMMPYIECMTYLKDSIAIEAIQETQGIGFIGSYYTNFTRWANNVWNQYQETKDTNFNAISVVQEDLENPINGIIIRAEFFDKITPAQKQQLIKILNDKPYLKMFIYAPTLEEHIIRQIENTAAVKLLSVSIEKINPIALTPFQGLPTEPINDKKSLAQLAEEFICEKQFLADLDSKDLKIQKSILMYSWGGTNNNTGYEEQYDFLKFEFTKLNSSIDKIKCYQIFDDIVRNKIIEAISKKDQDDFAKKYDEIFFRLLRLDRILTSEELQIAQQYMLTFPILDELLANLIMVENDYITDKSVKNNQTLLKFKEMIDNIEQTFKQQLSQLPIKDLNSGFTQKYLTTFYEKFNSIQEKIALDRKILLKPTSWRNKAKNFMINLFSKIISLLNFNKKLETNDSLPNISNQVTNLSTNSNVHDSNIEEKSISNASPSSFHLLSRTIEAKICKILHFPFHLSFDHKNKESNIKNPTKKSLTNSKKKHKK